MRRILLLSLTLAAALDTFAGGGRIVIVNTDTPNVGFNDPTPATPVGGNHGTTLGQQRLNVFQAAAEKWTNLIDIDTDIAVQASFAPIGACDESSAVLGQAAPFNWQRDFTNAPKANTWYPIALANKLAGRDINGSAPEIFTQFNAAVDNAQCLGDSNWYYGFDGENGVHSDLYVVVLHELAHGLGVSGAVRSPGFRDGRPAVSDTRTLDIKAGLRWDQMSQQQRDVSLTNTGHLVWDGPMVRANANRYLRAVTTLSITEPPLIAKNYDIGSAALIGPALDRASMTGTFVRAFDAKNEDGPSDTDGCSPFVNADAVRGNIAVVDRGDCFFADKARNAQAAGAIGVIIIDNNRDTCTPPSMGGEGPDVTIPVVSIAANDGDVLKAQLNANATVRGSLRVDPSQLAGTSNEGYLRLYAPCTDDPGSSTHHWDVVATPNLLMEPSINNDLRGVDLTLYQLLDIGWTLPARTGRPTGKRR